MLLRYFTYVTVGFFYAYSFLLFAGLASAVGNLPMVGFVGALLLFALAAGLALFRPRVSSVLALISAALLWPWCVAWAIDLGRSEHFAERWLLVLPCLPVLGITILAARSLRIRTASFPRFSVGPRWLTVRALLAVFPIGLVIAWQVWLRAAA